jgi:hypothetical protein
MRVQYRPKHQVQLNAGTPVPGATQGSLDCGVRAASVGVDVVTHGQKVPTITEMRRRMHTPGPQPTSILDAQRGVESFTNLRGRKPLDYLVRWTTDGLELAIANGRAAQVAIDYLTFNRLMAKTGDPNFAGGHSIVIYGQRQRGGRKWWLLWDSLDDARRPGIAGPGPRWVPASKVIAAAEAFAGGSGRVQSGVFSGGQKR